MSLIKRILFSLAGSKYDRRAGEKGQKYYFIFVQENGGELEKISSLFNETHLEVSINEVFGFEKVDKALTRLLSASPKERQY